jgi:deoxycytidylate deaminase
MPIDRTKFVSSAISDAEAVLGVVAPVGTRVDTVQEVLMERLTQFRYKLVPIRLSGLIGHFKLRTQLVSAPPGERIHSHMDAGNELRDEFGRADVLALASVRAIRIEREEAGGGSRDSPVPLPRTVYFLRSLKHPDEVRTLREVYGPGFFLLGVSSSRDERLACLCQEKGISSEDAERLLARDESEKAGHGQQTRKAFELADAFIALGNEDLHNKKQIWRTLDLLFGQTFHTPTREEHAMFLAYATAMRSGDLSRQVGAVVLSANGDVIATGANDVPVSRGGQYWTDGYVDWPREKPKTDQRDWARGFDSNKKKTAEIVDDFSGRVLGLAREKIAAIVQAGCSELCYEDKQRLVAQVREWVPSRDELVDSLKDSLVMDLTEFGRAVHAEMEALLCCARVGVSPRGGRLFTTTFPCHNCTKHIVAAGISEVFYIEPYPKSQAEALHGDAVVVAPGGPSDGGQEKRVVFRPFSGVGPRRFLDLFSLGLGMGRAVDRRLDVQGIPWDRKCAQLRSSMVPTSYLDREKAAESALESAKEARDERLSKQ